MLCRPERQRNVYFPLLTGDSITSSEIQLASIYDVRGTALLINEYVVTDGSYLFQRFDPDIYLLLGTAKIKNDHQIDSFFRKSVNGFNDENGNNNM